MTAAEAKLKAKAANTKIGNSQYNRIIKQIDVAAKKGEYSIWFYEPINDDALEQLKKDGFKVGSQQSDRNEFLTKINW